MIDGQRAAPKAAYGHFIQDGFPSAPRFVRKRSKIFDQNDSKNPSPIDP